MYPAVFLMMLACDQSSEPPLTPATPAAPEPTAAPTSTAAPAPAPSAVASGGGGSSLPNVAANLSKGQCSNGPGAEGADSYFTGSFTVDGSTVTGTETWILYANPKWQAKGGNDCTITWRLSGTVTSTGACGATRVALRTLLRLSTS